MSRFGAKVLLAATVAAGLMAGTGTASAQTQAGCRLAFEAGADQWLIQYDPLAQDVAERHFDVAVVNHGDRACGGAVRVELRGEQFGLGQPGDAQRLPYVIVDERGGVDVTPRAGQSARRVGARSLDLAPGERGLLRFSFAASPTGLLSSGLHSQNAFITLEGEGGLSLSEKPVTLGIQVASAALMGLKGEFSRRGGLATIDLGELTEGRRPLATTLYVLSTGGYSVAVNSANGGRLRQGSSEWYVSYGLALGDRAMDLASGDRFEIVSRRPRVDDYRLTINVGSVAGKRAGDYSDTLTFTVAAI